MILCYPQNISIAIVGKNEKFHILNDDENSRFVSDVEKRTAGGATGGDGGAGPGGNEAATIEDIDEPGDDDDSGDPQVQVAMET